MNINKLISHYFEGVPAPEIFTFDAESINAECNALIAELLKINDIELSVVQSFNYCLYEVLDNVLTHSGKKSGVLLSRFSTEKQQIQVLVADDGIGIHQSLTENDTYKHLTEAETLQHVILDKVTDGKGMGFGLYTTKNLITFAGGLLVIASGEHQLTYEGQQSIVSEIKRVEGTIVFMAVNTNREINANDVVDNRTDCAADFNETFLEDDDLDNLW
jgi:anti-sigma regulatory factor (Ser/Thr protein kinase)